MSSPDVSVAPPPTRALFLRTAAHRVSLADRAAGSSRHVAGLAKLLPIAAQRLKQSQRAAAPQFAMLRLNSQQRSVGDVAAGGPELLAHCCQDPDSAMFTVPPLKSLLSKHVTALRHGH